MTGAGTGQKIQGVAESAIVQQVGVATYWTAEQAAARENIKAVFERSDKAQWEIGDLLNIIAPNMGDGVNDEENTARLKQVAEENSRAYSTVRQYRQVAASYLAAERDQFRTWTDALDSLRAQTEATAIATAKPDTLISKALSTVTALEGRELDEHDRTGVRVLILAAQNALGEEPVVEKESTSFLVERVVTGIKELLESLQGKEIPEETRAGLRTIRDNITRAIGE